MIGRREQLFPARLQRAQRTGHTKGKNMKEKWDPYRIFMIFSMVLAGGTLVVVLIKLILEPRPNIFLIICVCSALPSDLSQCSRENKKSGGMEQSQERKIKLSLFVTVACSTFLHEAVCERQLQG